MAKARRHLLTPQELEIMHVVWELSDVTVRDVYEVLRRRRRVAYTTVMTVMQLLDKKGFLKRAAGPQRAHRYRAARPRRQALSALLREFVDRVFKGSAQPLVLHLLADGKLSKEELEAARREFEEKP